MYSCKKIFTDPDIRGTISIFCPLAVKSRSTTLIFEESVTFHQTKLISLMMCTILTVLPAISYVCDIFLICPLYTEVQQIRSYIEITCLRELLVAPELLRTRSEQRIVSIWYVATRKLCVVKDHTQVKIWSCTLYYKKCLLTHFTFHAILVPFKAKEKYRGVFAIQKSGDKTSSGEIGLDIRTHASPKVGQDQVSGGVSVLC